MTLWHAFCFSVFLLLPLIEIAFFIVVGQTIGLWPTLGLGDRGGDLGGLVLRQQGLSVLDADARQCE